MTERRAWVSRDPHTWWFSKHFNGCSLFSSITVTLRISADYSEWLYLNHDGCEITIIIVLWRAILPLAHWWQKGALQFHAILILDYFRNILIPICWWTRMSISYITTAQSISQCSHALVRFTRCWYYFSFSKCVDLSVAVCARKLIKSVNCAVISWSRMSKCIYVSRTIHHSSFIFLHHLQSEKFAH